MTTTITPNRSYGVGFRFGQVMLRDIDGLPHATSSTTPYYGLFIDSGKQLTINDPDVRRITHPGADTVVEYDILPPNEAASAELQVAGTDFDLDAALTGNLVITEGDSKRQLVNTDLKGFEKDVMFLAYQQSTKGGRRWRYFIMPTGVIVPRAIGFDDNPEVRTYPVAPHYATKDEFGVAFTKATSGGTRAQFITGISYGQPTWCAFLADGTAVEFNFDDDKPAVSASTIVVKIDGAIVTAGVTPTVDGITFAVAPAANKKVCVFYEH